MAQPGTDREGVQRAIAICRNGIALLLAIMPPPVERRFMMAWGNPINGQDEVDVVIGGHRLIRAPDGSLMGVYPDPAHRRKDRPVDATDVTQVPAGGRGTKFIPVCRMAPA